MLTVNGLQATALPHQVLVLDQKALPQQGPVHTQQPDAGSTTHSDVHEQQNPYSMQSSATQPPSVPRPAADSAAFQRQTSSAGERPAGKPGHSDMSQALLHNTAALESNLTAAQHGDGVDTSAEVDELRLIAADATDTAHQKEVRPGLISPASGAY